MRNSVAAPPGPPAPPGEAALAFHCPLNLTFLPSRCCRSFPSLFFVSRNAPGPICPAAFPNRSLIHPFVHSFHKAYVERQLYQAPREAPGTPRIKYPCPHVTEEESEVRRVIRFIQGHTASEWLNPNRDPHFLGSKTRSVSSAWSGLPPRIEVCGPTRKEF